MTINDTRQITEAAEQYLASQGCNLETCIQHFGKEEGPSRFLTMLTSIVTVNMLLGAARERDIN